MDEIDEPGSTGRQLRQSTLAHQPGQYAEMQVFGVEIPAFTIPDPVFDAELARHCALPTVALDEPGPSEEFKVARDRGEVAGYYKQKQSVAVEDDANNEEHNIRPAFVAHLPPRQGWQKVKSDGSDEEKAPQTNFSLPHDQESQYAPHKEESFESFADSVTNDLDWGSTESGSDELQIDNAAEGENKQHHKKAQGSGAGHGSKDITWSRLTHGPQWALLATVCQKYPFSQAVMILRLSSQETYSFLRCYLECWEKQLEWYAAIYQTPVFDLMQQSGVYSMSEEDDKALQRPTLPTDLIVGHELDHARNYLRWLRCNEFIPHLGEWCGTSRDFVWLPIETSILSSCRSFLVQERDYPRLCSILPEQKAGLQPFHIYRQAHDSDIRFQNAGVGHLQSSWHHPFHPLPYDLSLFFQQRANRMSSASTSSEETLGKCIRGPSSRPAMIRDDTAVQNRHFSHNPVDDYEPGDFHLNLGQPDFDPSQRFGSDEECLNGDSDTKKRQIDDLHNDDNEFAMAGHHTPVLAMPQMFNLHQTGGHLGPANFGYNYGTTSAPGRQQDTGTRQVSLGPANDKRDQIKASPEQGPQYNPKMARQPLISQALRPAASLQPLAIPKDPDLITRNFAPSQASHGISNCAASNAIVVPSELSHSPVTPATATRADITFNGPSFPASQHSVPNRTSEMLAVNRACANTTPDQHLVNADNVFPPAPEPRFELKSPEVTQIPNDTAQHVVEQGASKEILVSDAPMNDNMECSSLTLHQIDQCPPPFPNSNPSRKRAADDSDGEYSPPGQRPRKSNTKKPTARTKKATEGQAAKKQLQAQAQAQQAPAKQVQVQQTNPADAPQPVKRPRGRPRKRPRPEDLTDKVAAVPSQAIQQATIPQSSTPVARRKQATATATNANQTASGTNILSAQAHLTSGSTISVQPSVAPEFAAISHSRPVQCENYQQFWNQHENGQKLYDEAAYRGAQAQHTMSSSNIS